MSEGSEAGCEPQSDAATGWPMGLRMTCSAVPLQIEGSVEGGYIYFRARHGYWQLAIGATQDEAVDAALDGPNPPVSFAGESDCGYGDYAEARALLDEHLPKLRLPGCPDLSLTWRLSTQ